jgi:glucuronate isomerase
MLQRSPLSPDRFFAAEPVQRKIARQLYDSVLNLPLVCPFINFAPYMLPSRVEFPIDPLELLVLSDDYIVSRLKAHGFLQRNDNHTNSSDKNLAHRKFWQFFVDNSSSLRGMPADIWLSEILFSVFGIKERLASKNAQRIYDAISESLKQPEFQFLKLLDRFNIESMGVIDSPVEPHLEILKSSPGSKVLPCFNVDALFQIDAPGWRELVNQLANSCQIPITNAASFIQILQKQRSFFKSLGATTVIQSICQKNIPNCSRDDLDCILERGLMEKATPEDRARFSSQMLLEMAALCVDDNLVLQIKHKGNHFQTSGPEQADFSVGLRNLLNGFGKNPAISLILCPDEGIPLESLKNLSDSYPSLTIGAPEWFFNSLSSMQKYYDTCLENIGLNKSAGLTNPFNSFMAIPAQHDIWRRSGANWLAKLVVCGLVDLENAYEMIYAMAYGLAKTTYKL